MSGEMSQHTASTPGQWIHEQSGDAVEDVSAAMEHSFWRGARPAVRYE